MSPLLPLPQELRDKVLTILISIPDLSPVSWDEQTARERPAAANKDTLGSHPFVRYADTYSRVKSMPTLFVNRRLYGETKKCIARSKDRRSYVMDVMLVREQYLWYVSSLLYSTRIQVSRLLNTDTVKQADVAPPSRPHISA